MRPPEAQSVVVGKLFPRRKRMHTQRLLGLILEMLAKHRLNLLKKLAVFPDDGRRYPMLCASSTSKSVPVTNFDPSLARNSSASSRLSASMIRRRGDLPIVF